MNEKNDDEASPTIPAGNAFFAAMDKKAQERMPSGWVPPEPEELNDELDEFEVQELVGRGGMGAVYRARQHSLDREVAVKVLPKELAADPEFAERFRREARAMAELNHTHIVDVYEFGETESGFAFIVMEFVDGTDFRQLIRSGHLDEKGAMKAIRQICEALEYAHSKGYVHRDIKPANIFLNQEGQIKVGDFGLAKVMGVDLRSNQYSLTMTGAVMGTPDYAAPEQLKEGVIDHRADIYSLGVLFYEMLTGELPKGAFPVPSKQVGVDVRLDEVVLRAMQPDRELRYGRVSEVSSELDEIESSTAPAVDQKRARASSWRASSFVTRLAIISGGLWAGLHGLNQVFFTSFGYPHPVTAVGSLLIRFAFLLLIVSLAWLVWKWIGPRKIWRAGFALLALFPIFFSAHSLLTNIVSFDRISGKTGTNPARYVDPAKPDVRVAPEEVLQNEDGEALVVMTGDGPKQLVRFNEELQRLRSEKQRLITEDNLLGLLDLTTSEILPKEELHSVLTPEATRNSALNDQASQELDGGTFIDNPERQLTTLVANGIDSVKIILGPGTFDTKRYNFRILAERGYLKKIIFEGRGKDQTVLKITDISPGGSVHVIFRDLTIHSHNDSLFDQRRGGLLVGMDRCRVVGFDDHSGDNLFSSYAGLCVYARDSVFAGRIDGSDGTGSPLYGPFQIALFERCVFGNLAEDYFSDRPRQFRNAQMHLCQLDAAVRDTFYPEDPGLLPVVGWELTDCNFLSPLEMEEKIGTAQVNHLLKRLQ